MGTPSFAGSMSMTPTPSSKVVILRVQWISSLLVWLDLDIGRKELGGIYKLFPSISSHFGHLTFIHWIKLTEHHSPDR